MYLTYRLGNSQYGRLLICGFTRSTDATETDAGTTIWRVWPTGALDGTLLGSNGTGIARIDPRSGNAGTTAGCVVIPAGGGAFVSGTAFDRSDGAADAIVWKLRT